MLAQVSNTAATTADEPPTPSAALARNMVEVALDSPNCKPVTPAEEKEEMDTASPANKMKGDAKASSEQATEAAPVAVEGASPVSPETPAMEEAKNPEAVVGEKRSSEAAPQPAKASKSPAKSPAAVTENDGNSNVGEASSIA